MARVTIDHNYYVKLIYSSDSVKIPSPNRKTAILMRVVNAIAWEKLNGALAILDKT